MFLESTQNQRCFNVEFYGWINVDKSTSNQRGYQVDRRHDVISTYINVESTLSVCWEAILEPILLYRASKCKQTKEQGSEDCLRTYFLPFYKIIVSFFSVFYQDANKARSNCAIIGCNLSKKHKPTLYKTLNGEPNYVDHKRFFNFC